MATLIPAIGACAARIQGHDHAGQQRFRRKQDNIVGIQVADLCAHPTARHLLKPDVANQAYDVVRPHIYVSGRINGLKVYPK